MCDAIEYSGKTASLENMRVRQNGVSTHIDIRLADHSSPLTLILTPERTAWLSRQLAGAEAYQETVGTMPHDFDPLGR